MQKISGGKIMNTLNDVAEIVFETKWDIGISQAVSIELENKSGILTYYGVTIKNILDCYVLAVGYWGSGHIHTKGWDESCDCNDVSKETFVDFLSECLQNDGFPQNPKITKIELVLD